MIKIEYDKCPFRYNCYYNCKKIKKKKDLGLDKNSGELVFLEKSKYLGFWGWFCFIFDIICNLLCGGCGIEDYRDLRKKQKKITISYKGLVDDIKVTFCGLSVIKLTGFESYSITDIEEKENPKIIKNAKLFKKLTFIIFLSLVALVFLILAIALITT